MSEGNKSRRAALGLFAGASALAAMPGLALPESAMSMVASYNAEDDHAIALWEAHFALREPFLDAWRAHEEAEDRLPWWAKSGPERLYGDGRIAGLGNGWPAIQGVAPPVHPGAHKLIRPSPAHFRRLFEISKDLYGETPSESGLRSPAARTCASQEREKGAGG